uniref:Uncharacterized protein n=1 Tax=Octopus bimaculoides TaxID=37653 RepID=A0A0L8H3K4_OCTBM
MKRGSRCQVKRGEVSWSGRRCQIKRGEDGSQMELRDFQLRIIVPSEFIVILMKVA